MSKSQGNHNKKMSENQGYYGPDISGVQTSEDYRKRQEVERAIDNDKLTRKQRFMAFFQNGRLKFATGIIMLMTGIYLLISFLSHKSKRSVETLPAIRSMQYSYTCK